MEKAPTRAYCLNSVLNVKASSGLLCDCTISPINRLQHYLKTCMSGRHPVTYFLYFVVNSCGTPLVYYMGIEENRRQAQDYFRTISNTGCPILLGPLSFCHFLGIWST